MGEKNDPITRLLLLIDFQFTNHSNVNRYIFTLNPSILPTQISDLEWISKDRAHSRKHTPNFLCVDSRVKLTVIEFGTMLHKELSLVWNSKELYSFGQKVKWKKVARCPPQDTASKHIRQKFIAWKVDLLKFVLPWNLTISVCLLLRMSHLSHHIWHFVAEDENYWPRGDGNQP